MIANVGGLVLGTVLEHLVSTMDSSIASAMVMTLTYAILFFGFVLLSSRSYSIFRVNYFDRDEYSFEYVVPVVPIGVSPSKGGLKSEEIATASDSEVSYIAALTRSCDAIATSSHLSTREHEVLCELARGKTISSIASGLVLSENTVKAHTKSIYRKLGVHTREELLAVIERCDADA
jgi:DNA-binding CsgD family transcriptional regulator